MTAIDGVSAAGAALQPMITHQGKAYTTAWYPDINKDEPAVVAYSGNGWPDKELGVEYLHQALELGTADSTFIIKHGLMNPEPSLLILDGHSSHTCPGFLIYAVEQNIIVLCLPSHTSHTVQPLDVNLFKILQRYYSQELDNLTRHGLCNIGRNEFFKYYHRSITS